MLASILILTTLGAACSAHRRIHDSHFILATRPTTRPATIDGSPKPCPECSPVNGQKMFKFTERDFIADKKKHIEKDDFITYLLDLLQATQAAKSR